MKVLVVDDSPLTRGLLRNILTAGGHDVETADNGLAALQMLERFPADVVTLDIEMPVMDGLTCLRELMTTNPRPVVVVTALSGCGEQAAMAALEMGAVDVMDKPRRNEGGLRGVSDAVLRRVEAAAIVRNARIHPLPEPSHRPVALGAAPKLVLVGASTGAPPVVADLLTHLPADFPAPVLVALHMASEFTGRFVKRIAGLSQGLRIVELVDEAPLEPGTAYVANGGNDVVVVRDEAQRLVARSVPVDETILWHPAVGRLVASAMSVLPAKNLVGVMLTGMGDDGAEEMARLRVHGGVTIAESEATAVVYGMPRALVERGGASVVLDNSRIRAQLEAWAQARGG